MAARGRSISRFLTLAVSAALAVCAAPLAAGDATPSSAWDDARQLVVVTTPDWSADHGTLRTFTRDAGGTWTDAGLQTPVSVGRAGLGWGRGLHPWQSDAPQKAEGDGRAPAGVFRIGSAFGYADDVDTALDYQPMQATHWCVDVTTSPLYNRIVDTREAGDAAVAGSTEPMRRDLHLDGDSRYRTGFVIEHNAERRPGSGSCIFAHLRRAPGEATAGCTAMSDGAMTALLQWLDAEKHPVFVLLPESEYARRRDAWQLPDGIGPTP